MSGGGGRAAFGAIFRRHWWRVLVALPLFPLLLLMTVPSLVLWLVTGSS